MKDNPVTARKRMKRWRRLNLKRHRTVSAAWKERNPTWYIGPSKIRLLTTALINGNDKSKIWHDAGITMRDWIIRGPYLIEGDKLAPIRTWREFDLTLPYDLRRFLHPDNFQLIKK